jgi:hypothetical protein
MTAIRFPGVIYRPIENAMTTYSAVWSPSNDNPAFCWFRDMAERFVSRV